MRIQSKKGLDSGAFKRPALPWSKGRKTKPF